MSDRVALEDYVDDAIAGVDATDVGADPAGTAAAAVTALIAGAPGALDTLDELAAAFGDDANFVTTVTNALALKAPLASPAITGTPTGITKSHVGLGNVDNTADTAKPVSTAQQTALDLKANLASPTFTGVATSPAWAASGLTGATAASRYVGSTSTGGAPASGTFVTGDWITTIFAGIIPAIFVCTAGGTPGTWVNLTLLYATLASPTFTGTVTLPLVTGTGVDTDSTMAANSDTKLASQKAVKTALALKATAIAQGRTKHGGTTDYSIPGVVLTTDNTFGLTINTLFYDFFIVDTPITLDQMAFNVTTTPATTAQVRMGIYAADTDWQPTGAPTVDAGATSVANGFTGVKTASVGVTLPAGRYMTAINCDVTLGVRVFRGFPSIGSWDSSLATGGALSGGSVGSTYGALPTPTPTAWTQGRFIGNHHCVMRISTP